MAVLFFPDADAEVDYPLASDPDVVAVNTITALARYQVTGDYGALNVPPEATVVTVKPLSASGLASAGARAGAAPALGSILHAEAAEAAYTEAWKAAEAEMPKVQRAAVMAWRDDGMDDAHEGAAEGATLTEAAQASSNKARALYLDSLDKPQRGSYDAYVEWGRRRDVEVLRLGWVGISNWPDVSRGELVAALDKVRPFHIQAATRSEIVRHIMRASTLPPLGKASSDSQSGAATPSRCTHGPASRAKNSTPGVDAEIVDGRESGAA